MPMRASRSDFSTCRCAASMPTVALWISRAACSRMASMCSLPMSVISTNFQASSLPCLRIRTDMSISASFRWTLRVSWARMAESAPPGA
jgi:hypothetical protein